MLDKGDFKLYDIMARRRPVKVQFSNLANFLEEITNLEISVVRLDVFPVIRPSEVSFVHYITMTLYVTAYHSSTYTMYEYTEPLTTQVSADLAMHDEVAMALTQERFKQVEHQCNEVVPQIRRGRYVFDSEEVERGINKQ